MNKKDFFLLGIATFSKLLLGLIILKTLSYYVGAAGVGKLGQFMSALSIATVLAGGGIGSGITSYVSQHREDTNAVNNWVGNAVTIGAVSSLFFCIVAGLFSGQLSNLLFKSANYKNVIALMSAMLFLISAVNLLTALGSAYKRPDIIAGANTTGLIVGGTIVFIASRSYGTAGAMYGLIVAAIIPIIYLIPAMRTIGGLTAASFKPRVDMKIIQRYGKYSIMLLFTICTMPISQMMVRSTIEAHADWSAVGLWQASTRLSDIYLQFILIFMANYYLPRLAEQRDLAGLKRELFKACKIILPFVALCGTAILLGSDILIPVLFSHEFDQAKNLLPWIVLGDLFRTLAYAAGYIAVAKSATLIYIAAEIFQGALFIFLCKVLIPTQGVIGASHAYFYTYAIYAAVAAICTCIYFSRYNADHSH
jgi:O-antigen/teichoic acid export membrane protein